MELFSIFTRITRDPNRWFWCIDQRRLTTRKTKILSKLKSSSKNNFLSKFKLLARTVFCCGKNIDRRKRYTGLLIITFSLLFFLNYSATIAQAQSPGDPAEPYQYVEQSTGKSAWDIAKQGIESIAFAPIIGVLHIIAYFCKLFLLLAAWVLDATLNPSLYNFTGSEIIKKGWVVVRDACNLFFLLALLFIAFCTILKIEKYHAKKTLLMLIIMALLINFSKPIAIFIFDGSQLLMNTFLREITSGNQTASTMYSQASKIAEIVYGQQSYGITGGSAIAAKLLFVIIFLFMYAVALIVIAIFLIIRIVAIMLLIIVSPFAFFASVIPDFNKLSSSWWDAIFKYSYFGPAAAFFLLLGTSLVPFLDSFKLPLSNAGASAGLDDNIVRSIIQYFTVLVFLYASIIMANKFSLQFSKAITDRADKIMKWAGKGVYRVPRWAARTTGVTGAVQQRIATSRFGKYLTKEGRKAAQEDREATWAERFGVEGAKAARDKKKVAETKEKWKKEGKTEGDYLRFLNSKNALERRAAAQELVKQGKVKDDATYEKVLDALKGEYATVDAAIAAKHDELTDAVKEVKKKRIDLVANEESRRTSIDKLVVGEKLMGEANPGTIKDWDIQKIVVDAKLQDALRNTYKKYDKKPKIQEKILEDMSADKLAAGESAAIW